MTTTQQANDYIERCKKYDITLANLKNATKYYVQHCDSLKIISDLKFLGLNQDCGTIDSIKIMNQIIDDDLGPIYDKTVKGENNFEISVKTSEILNYHRHSILNLLHKKCFFN